MALDIMVNLFYYEMEIGFIIFILDLFVWRDDRLSAIREHLTKAQLLDRDVRY